MEKNINAYRYFRALLSKRRGNARVIKILLNVSKISRECIPLPLRSSSSPDLRLKTSLSENGMKLISRLERWCCYDRILDDRIRPSFWSTYWKSDTSSWCSKSQIFSKCFYRYIPSRGKNDDAQTKSSCIILKVLLRLLWVVSSCDHSISLNELCHDKQHLKNKEKIFNTDGDGRDF